MCSNIKTSHRYFILKSRLRFGRIFLCELQVSFLLTVGVVAENKRWGYRDSGSTE